MAGNQGNNRVAWQEWQLQFLKENWQAMTAQQLSDEIGITRTKVREKKYELGLLVLELEYWTMEQVLFLRRNYKKKGDTELAQMFNARWHKNKGWSKKHIEKKRRYLGLKRTDDEKAAILARSVGKGIYASANKIRWKEIAAPKGEMRINWYGNRPVKVIKTNKGFVHYARWLYRQHYGKIPSGKIVRLKDNDPMNVVPENLYLITRAENARLNNALKTDPDYGRRKAVRELNKNIYQIKKIIENAKQTKRS